MVQYLHFRILKFPLMLGPSHIKSQQVATIQADEAGRTIRFEIPDVSWYTKSGGFGAMRVS